MADTVAEVRRDIEQTRERMSTTLSQLEHKLNVKEIVRDHPWPALALAVGAGVLLSGSSADVKAAAATVTATQGASSKVATLLDDVVATLVSGVQGAFEERLQGLVEEVKTAIGAPPNRTGASSGQRATGGRAGDGAAARPSATSGTHGGGWDVAPPTGNAPNPAVGG